MASSWTHAIAAVAIAATLAPCAAPRHIWLTVAVAAVVPDIDAIGRPFGAGDLTFLGGHRAFTHSLTFAAAFALLLQFALFREKSRNDSMRYWLVLTAAIASHGALDALTQYGEGVQFLAPWSTGRHWAPWRALGDGVVRDTIAFIVFYVITCATIAWRRLDAPTALKPRFLNRR